MSETGKVHVLDRGWAPDPAPPEPTAHPMVSEILDQATAKAEALGACGIFVVLVAQDGTAWSNHRSAGPGLMLLGATTIAYQDHLDDTRAHHKD